MKRSSYGGWPAPGKDPALATAPGQICARSCKAKRYPGSIARACSSAAQALSDLPVHGLCRCHVVPEAPVGGTGQGQQLAQHRLGVGHPAQLEVGDREIVQSYAVRRVESGRALE